MITQIGDAEHTMKGGYENTRSTIGVTTFHEMADSLEALQRPKLPLFQNAVRQREMDGLPELLWEVLVAEPRQQRGEDVSPIAVLMYPKADYSGKVIEWKRYWGRDRTDLLHLLEAKRRIA